MGMHLKGQTRKTWHGNCSQEVVVLHFPDTPVSVLLISADPSDHSALARILARSNWDLRVRTTCREALALLRELRLPVVICDDASADGWRSLLVTFANWTAPPALIVSSRLADERLWAEVLNLGGYDVLPTPFDRTEVLRVCLQAWQQWERKVNPVRVKAAG